jgi:hypothetical protein
LAKHTGSKRRGFGLIKRFNDDFVQLSGPPQFISQSSHRMSPRDLVTPISANDQQPLLSQRTSQSGQKLKGGVVRPLQIVQENNCRRATGDGLEGATNGFDEHRLITFVRGRSEFRQQQGQVLT